MRVFLLAIWLSTPGWAAESLVQRLESHSFELSKPAKPISTKSELPVAVEISQDSPLLRPALIAAIAVDKLKKGGLAAYWDRNYVALFDQGVDATRSELRPLTVEFGALTTPHLVLSVQIEPDTAHRFLILQAEVAAFEFRRDQSDPLIVRAHRVWSAKMSRGELERAEIETSLIQWLRRELGGLLQNRKSLTFEKMVTQDRVTSRFTFRPKSRAEGTGRNFTYQLGLSAGTPAIGNLHLGIWGTPTLPFAFNVSGMYWSREQRAVQTELLYLHDTHGALQQGFGLALTAFNEHSVERQDVVNGTLLSTVQTTNIDRLKIHLGPVYTATWKNFRAQLGLGFRLGQGTDSAIRPLFQLGFTPDF